MPSYYSGSPLSYTPPRQPKTPAGSMRHCQTVTVKEVDSPNPNRSQRAEGVEEG